MGEAADDSEHVVMERGEGGSIASYDSYGVDISISKGSSVMRGPSSKIEPCELATESTVLLVSDPERERRGLCHGWSWGRYEAKYRTSESRDFVRKSWTACCH
jgi:hypothetical protein